MQTTETAEDRSIGSVELLTRSSVYRQIFAENILRKGNHRHRVINEVTATANRHVIYIFSWVESFEILPRIKHAEGGLPTYACFMGAAVGVESLNFQRFLSLLNVCCNVFFFFGDLTVDICHIINSTIFFLQGCHKISAH